MPSVEQDNTPPTKRSGGLSGRVVVFATLSLFVIIPVIAVLISPMLAGNSGPMQLDYDQRADWFMLPVKARPLKYSKFVAAETGKQYKKTDLTIDPDVERVLQRCAGLAQGEDFLSTTDARDELLALAEEEANGFYPPYLLATWYAANADADAHDRWIRIAFDRAGGAIAQRLIDSRGKPVAGYTLPPVAIGYDRVTKGKLDATLVLIYPRPTSEANGFVYLPTYRSVYRLTDPALPLGVDPGLHPRLLTLLPQPSDGTDPNWFSVPDGAVGRLDDAVVSPNGPQK